MVYLEGSRAPHQLCSQGLVAGLPLVTVMLGSTQSKVGTRPPVECGVLLPRRWSEGTPPESL